MFRMLAEIFGLAVKEAIEEKKEEKQKEREDQYRERIKRLDKRIADLENALIENRKHFQRLLGLYDEQRTLNDNLKASITEQKKVIESLLKLPTKPVEPNPYN